jgi:predicted RNase H-like HicB family nuclease
MRPVSAERLRAPLVAVTPSRTQVVAEAGGWSAFIPGLPVAADGATFDEAVEVLVAALREYAADWQDRLRDVVSHKDNWPVAALVGLSDDRQLREWLVG